MKSRKPEDLGEVTVIGVDIGKDTFHLVGFDHEGHRVLRKKIKRLALKATFEMLPRCVVGMEACMSAHFVSRMLRELGFEPRIIPAIYVKPFNKGQKNDYNDAEARISWICRQCIVFGRGWWHAAPPRSIRSARF